MIGGGIIGLATAMTLARSYPDRRFVLLEKEAEVARHQTGHNSGVIHAGIYYAPGSQKANFCSTGGRLLREFCDERGIPYRMCGKVIVAVDDEERPRLQDLYERGTANGAEGLEMVGPGAPTRAGTPRHRSRGNPLPEHRHHRLRRSGERLCGRAQGERRRAPDGRRGGGHRRARRRDSRGDDAGRGRGTPHHQLRRPARGSGGPHDGRRTRPADRPLQGRVLFHTPRNDATWCMG